MVSRTVEPRSISTLLLPLAVSLATAATLVVNYLANALPINGQTTGDVTRRFEVYFVPAGYVFSIWGLIYLGVIAYSVYLSLTLRSARTDSGAARAIAPWYVLTAVANCCWLFAWHHNRFPLSMLLMVVLLVALIVIYRIQAGRPPTSTLERWTVHIPFRVYLGWVSVATIANATITLDDAGWSGFGLSEPAWGVIMLVVAAALGLVMSLRHHDVAFALVLIWALIGIAVRLHETTSILIASLIGAVAVGIAIPLSARLRTHLPSGSANNRALAD
ncbi:tryptophan-rich sensory protein [Mycolicibacterium sp. ND9-15]|uniref:tryptophan-rich sensory protein n=1 Tax=Mycolicibacterium sp. ND9-15 TaxID=3042320 RepID=UPI002DD8BE04|nr:tryptophan-rich sensory protein [Mycolicibacterium sp. ND9-15]WSE58343.1 tryptophan-rich sensory protein [Mycolicibacterium sp. ND9-15]